MPGLNLELIDRQLHQLGFHGLGSLAHKGDSTVDLESGPAAVVVPQSTNIIESLSMDLSPVFVQRSRHYKETVGCPDIPYLLTGLEILETRADSIVASAADSRPLTLLEGLQIAAQYPGVFRTSPICFQGSESKDGGHPKIWHDGTQMNLDHHHGPECQSMFGAVDKL